MTRTRASSGLEALLAQRATTTASAKETAPETSTIKEKETPAAIKSEMSTDEAMEVEITVNIRIATQILYSYFNKRYLR